MHEQTLPFRVMDGKICSHGKGGRAFLPFKVESSHEKSRPRRYTMSTQGSLMTHLDS